MSDSALKPIFKVVKATITGYPPDGTSRLFVTVRNVSSDTAYLGSLYFKRHNVDDIDYNESMHFGVSLKPREKIESVKKISSDLSDVVAVVFLSVDEKHPVHGVLGFKRRFLSYGFKLENN